MHVYKYQYLKEKLAPYHIHGPKSRIPTEYDQLMRDVLQIGIPEDERRKQKRDQDGPGGKKLTSRVSLILKPEKAHKQDVKGNKWG